MQIADCFLKILIETIAKKIIIKNNESCLSIDIPTIDYNCKINFRYRYKYDSAITLRY